MHIKILVFIVSLYLSETVSDQNELSKYTCSSKKSSQECVCVYKKDLDLAFPILSADCSRMGLEQVPKIDGAEILDVSFNSIEMLHPNKSSLEVPQIRRIRMSYNRLNFVHHEYFQNTPDLIELDLSHNELVKFSNSLVFSTLTKLEVLNLSSNQISTLPENVFGNLGNLQELDLSYNYLGSVFKNNQSIFNSTLGLHSNLTTLKLDGLGITTLSLSTFEGATDLKYLSLANNPLTTIPHLPNTLTYLDLSGSQISRILPLDLACPSLKVLKLNRLTQLKSVEASVFQNLEVLEELHLNECRKLKKIDPFVFGTSKVPIKKLYLSKSGLQTISDKFLDIFKSIEYIDLQNNPWTCDCDVLWLSKLNITESQSENLRCAAPFDLFNRKVVELVEKDVCLAGVNYYQMVLISLLCFLLAVLSALIVYLIYLGPLYYKNRYRNIGPQSPYYENTLSQTSVMDPEQPY